MGFNEWDYLQRLREQDAFFYAILDNGEQVNIDADLADVLDEYELMMDALAKIRKAANSAIV